MEKFIGLSVLQDRDGPFFYRVLVENSWNYAHSLHADRGTGLPVLKPYLPAPAWHLDPHDDVDRIPALLRNAPHVDVRLIVATDNERILGLGDQGAGGMGIPVGKLSLYCERPASIPALPADKHRRGNEQRRIVQRSVLSGLPAPSPPGRTDWKVLDAFVAAVKGVFPQCLVQWEDFHKNIAFDILDRYHQRIPSFTDDVQGTAAVGVAGILAPCGSLDRSSPRKDRLCGSRGRRVGIGRLVPWRCGRSDSGQIHAARSSWILTPCCDKEPDN